MRILRVALVGVFAMVVATPSSPALAGDELASNSLQEPDANAEAAPQSVNNPRLAKLLKEASFSPGVSDVARMAKLGVDAELLIAHVKNSEKLYKLRPEDIAHLKDQAVPDAVITAMIERGAELRAQPVPTVETTQSQPQAGWGFSEPNKVVYVAAFTSPTITPASTVTIIGRSDLRRGLSFRRYFYTPRSYYASYRASGGRYLSYGAYSRYYGTTYRRGYGYSVCR